MCYSSIVETTHYNQGNLGEEGMIWAFSSEVKESITIAMGKCGSSRWGHWSSKPKTYLLNWKQDIEGKLGMADGFCNLKVHT